MPQLDISTYFSQIFWLLFIISIIYYALNNLIIPKLEQIFFERSKHLSESLQHAEVAKSEAIKIENECQSKLSHARKSAAILISETAAELEKHVAKKLADAEIELKKMQKSSERNIAKFKLDASDKLDEIIITSTKKILKDMANIELSEEVICSQRSKEDE